MAQPHSDRVQGFALQILIAFTRSSVRAGVAGFAKGSGTGLGFTLPCVRDSVMGQGDFGQDYCQGIGL